MSEERVAAEKAAWRERFRRLRAGLAETDQRRASDRIVGRLLALPEMDDADAVHVYWPLPGEVDTRPLVESLVARGCTVVLPALEGADRRLVHRRFLGEDLLGIGPWGTREPSPSTPEVAVSDLDLVVVPGLAMGRDGSRLGYGGGYYDRFLSAATALRVGVVWHEALVDAVPAEPHDARLDLVVTDAETVRVDPDARGDARNTAGREA